MAFKISPTLFLVGRRMMSNVSYRTVTGIRAQEHAMIVEQCILVDRDDNPIGHQSKKDCHLVENINAGLLHRAFSVLLFNSKNEFLLTQRSDTKITFPSYFTNTCCSHPLYTECELEQTEGIGVRRAAQKRLHLELGIKPTDVPLENILYMTRILYKFNSDETWGEHELDYILIIHRDVELNPNPEEVKLVKYLKRDQLDPYLDQVRAQGEKISPWFQLIANNFLYKYWDNLDSLSKFKDHKKIHSFL